MCKGEYQDIAARSYNKSIGTMVGHLSQLSFIHKYLIGQGESNALHRIKHIKHKMGTKTSFMYE